MFDYRTITTRNSGFVTEAEQERLHRARVFVCGTGGMGGAAILALARAGVGHLPICDIDTFEVSNLNRQVFSWLHTVDQHKAVATAEQLMAITPELDVEVLQDDWTDQVERLVCAADVVINGTDDLGASLLLYRTAKAQGKAVIDAYASPLPSVYVTRAGDPMPEERLSYPTRDVAWDGLTDEIRSRAFQAEAVYVMTQSSSAFHIDLDLAGEVAAGERSRMSFAPMVITSGMLMAYEAVAILLGQENKTDHRGWFFNPYRARVERPRSGLVAAVLKPLVARKLKQLMSSS